MKQTLLQEIDRLFEALECEKEEDYEQFNRLVQRLSLEDRKEQGFCWHPVEIRKSGYTIGEHAYLVIQRPEGTDGPHRFRSGAMVKVYSLNPNKNRRELSGVINYLDRNRMKVILSTKDLPDWTSFDQIAVDLVFDDRTYLLMNRALKEVQKARGNRLAELRDIAYGVLEAEFEPVKEKVHLPHLNPSQNQAIENILAARQFAIVHGPPGTGKTTTLVEAIRLMSEREGTILVTAPSNAATDLLTYRLAEKGLQVTRIGNIGRMDDLILKHTLEAQISQHPESKHIKKVKLQAAELRRKARKLRGRRNYKVRSERRYYQQEARELSAWVRQLEDRLIDQLISGAHVVTSTLAGADHPILKDYTFKTLVIDEAAQALEPACWIAIRKASRVIMAGDPHQLPPTIKSKKARELGLERTLLEKCIERLPEVSLLNVQYRMHEQIMYFSNHHFYKGALRAHSTVAQARLPLSQYHPVNFIDTAGCGFEEEIEPKYLSRFNPGEFLILREHLLQLADQFEKEAIPLIGIISPYRQQVQYIKEQILEEAAEGASSPNTNCSLSALPLDINTIDAFQGQEREIIYISLVRSNLKSEIGFLQDYRRMNVAMTRARKKLIIIGDSATIGGDPFYRKVLEYCEKEGNYKTAWMYIQ